MGQLLVKRVQGTYVRVGLKRDPDLGKVARAAPHSLLCQRSHPDGDGAALAPELVATRSSNAETHQQHPGRVPGWVHGCQDPPRWVWDQSPGHGGTCGQERAFRSSCSVLRAHPSLPAPACSSCESKASPSPIPGPSLPLAPIAPQHLHRQTQGVETCPPGCKLSHGLRTCSFSLIFLGSRKGEFKEEKRDNKKLTPWQ